MESIKLFKHFKVKPRIHGLSDHEKDGLEMETLFEGEDWKYLKEKNSDSIAVMGGIPYSFDSYDIDLMDDPKAEALREIVNSHLVLEFEIGDLNITASREALEFTKHTKKNLLKKIEKVGSELETKVEEDFGDC